jgi:hypothetical protein
MPEQLRSLFGVVWESGANLLFLVAWQSSQPIRARIANFQTAFNALSARRQKYFVWRPRFSFPQEISGVVRSVNLFTTKEKK